MTEMRTQLAPKDATAHTRAVLESVSFDLDAADFDRASRGLIATHPTGRIDGPGGSAVWDTSRYAFIERDAESPPTVHPSLWRQAQLDAIHGVFEVAPRVWQVRGYDISNITFIEGRDGWVIIDPLTVEVTARAAIGLMDVHVAKRPVTAVIYTHSHTDHFGGVLGVTSQAEVDRGNCRIIAPEGFLLETVAENVIGGPAMGRRGTYQFGVTLAPGPRGHVDCGLGKAIPAFPSGLIAPTEDITYTGEELLVDGVRIVFQNTPGTEAPAEMNFHFPEHGWLCMAENCTHTMHNLVPIRGAQVRNALMWSKYIGEAMELFGSQSDVMFASHHWPRWGAADIEQFLRLQRDLYRWIHDQTMRLANHGFTPSEIAEQLRTPPEFLAQSHTRGYYGHLVHNIKAVYQRYLSWYDGNPSHLNPHPPVEAATRYVEFMGGADSVVEKAQVSFDAGDYRWTTEVLNHVVFARPDHDAGRALLADAYEQLGYQSESATYRNAYLTAAQELREGPPRAAPVSRRSLVQALTPELVFDSVAMRLKSDEVAGLRATINFSLTDIGEQWILGLENRALHSIKGRLAELADATLTLTRATLIDVITGAATFVEAIADGRIVLDGDATALDHIFGHLDTFMSGFAIVEP